MYICLFGDVHMYIHVHVYRVDFLSLLSMYIHVHVSWFQSRKDLMGPFSDGETRVLVCTDLASRGIDNDKVGV